MESSPDAPAAVPATARLSACGSVVTARTGSIEAAVSWADVNARSLAMSRTMTASGIRKAIATIEVTAAQTSAIVLRTVRLPRCVEHDADSAHGPQVSRPGGSFAQLAAQPGAVHVDGLVVAVRLPPHLGEQLPPGDHHAGPGRQVGEQVKLAARQFERRAVKNRFAPGEVDAQPAHANDLRGAAVRGGPS